ncbi:MAG TPA: hypothetical protein VFL27_01620 [Candidatus Dormibacteraeota bacterium]|nr:hypothetical protein [Candidatus Dormibacteraeota bacterium]
MKSWARVPIVTFAAAILALAGTTAVLADHDPGGASSKQHPGVRPPHQGDDANSNTNGTGSSTTNLTGGTAQPTTGATTPQTIATNTHHGATVIKDLACGIATPPFGQVTATDSIFVLTPNGHATLVCKGDLPSGVGPKSAIVIDNLTCSAPGVLPTTDSHTTITPSGEVSLTCHFGG